jgi:thiol-disulfide isomerase/thioredoxin
MKNVIKKSWKLKLQYSLGLLVIVFSFGSCGNEDAEKADSNEPKPMVVTGQIKNFTDTISNFSYYTHEFLDDLSKEEVVFDSVGSFEMTLDATSPVKGWFSLGKVPKTEVFTYTTVDGIDSTHQAGTMDFKMFYIYLEPGDSLHVALDAENIEESIKFSGKAAENNRFVNLEEWTYNSYKHKYLKNWYDVVNRDPDNYKENVNKLRDEKLDFLKKHEESGEISPFLIDLYRNSYVSSAVSSKINYPSIHASYNDLDSTELPDDYYDFVHEVNLKESIGDNGIGYFYNLKSFLNKKYELAKKENPDLPEFYEWTKTELPEDVRYEFMAYSLGGDFSRRLYDEFGENSKYPQMAKVVKEKYQHLEGMLEGNPAPEVVFQDLEGNDVELADFKGKYTYIDLWATWCGPCIKEIPSLQKLEKEYEDGNIHFVSVSIDEEEDLDKWKRFVKEKNLHGNQLIADKVADSILSKAFNIKNIPRFLLLDPEGKVVDASAPFPSDPNLVALLEELDI